MDNEVEGKKNIVINARNKPSIHEHPREIIKIITKLAFELFMVYITI